MTHVIEKDNIPILLNRDLPFNEALLQGGAVILVNKPLYRSSFQIVKKVRDLWNLKKVGHAGTLDPLAEGLLILCTGNMTKQASYFQSLPKRYEGIIELGKTTPSYDLETPFNNERPWHHLTEEEVYRAVQQFTGSILQVPPAYAALKIDGKRAYKKARRGHTVTLSAREVYVEAFHVKEILFPKIYFEVVCSKGTYIRSLAHDLGQHLGVGAHLAALKRTQIGPYHLNDALDVPLCKAPHAPR